MDKQSFKKLLDDALEPMRSDIKIIKKGLESVKENVENVREVQEKRVLPSVIETEVTVKSYADSYKINQHNIERVDTRLEDLRVPHFTSSSV